jgi:hypothetical protein
MTADRSDPSASGLELGDEPDLGVRIYDLGYSTDQNPSGGLLRVHEMICVDLLDREANVKRRRMPVEIEPAFKSAENARHEREQVPPEEAHKWLMLFALERSIAATRALEATLSAIAQLEYGQRAKRSRAAKKANRTRARAAAAAKKTSKKSAKKGKRRRR